MSTPSARSARVGQLLVATPALLDPNFTRTVVLLLDHDEAGSLGVVLNRPSSLEVEDVLPDWGPFLTGAPVLFQGGPVALDSALGLAAVSVAAPDEDPLGFRRVVGGLGLIDLDTPPEVLAAELAALRIFAGYSGWGPGQLDAELAEGSWYVLEGAPSDAFTAAPESLWSAVLRRQGGRLALAATYPEDPSLN